MTLVWNSNHRLKEQFPVLIIQLIKWKLEKSSFHKKRGKDKRPRTGAWMYLRISQWTYLRFCRASFSCKIKPVIFTSRLPLLIKNRRADSIGALCCYLFSWRFFARKEVKFFSKSFFWSLEKKCRIQMNERKAFQNHNNLNLNAEASARKDQKA